MGACRRKLDFSLRSSAQRTRSANVASLRSRVGWGWDRLGGDAIDDDFQPVGHVAVGETDDAVAGLPEPGGALGVVLSGFEGLVNRAVDLDHQLAGVMHEVGDVAANRRLPPEVGLQLAQLGPEKAFGVGGILAEPTGAGDAAGGNSLAHPFRLEGGRFRDGGGVV